MARQPRVRQILHSVAGIKRNFSLSAEQRDDLYRQWAEMYWTAPDVGRFMGWGTEPPPKEEAVEALVALMRREAATA